jgi:hypothetical protein
VWQEEAERNAAASGVFVAGFVTTGHTVYPRAAGCPAGGEVTADVVGVHNPADGGDDGEWQQAVRAVAAAVGRRFGQDVVFVTFSRVELVRLRCAGGG